MKKLSSTSFIRGKTSTQPQTGPTKEVEEKEKEGSSAKKEERKKRSGVVAKTNLLGFVKGGGKSVGVADVTKGEGGVDRKAGKARPKRGATLSLE